MNRKAFTLIELLVVVAIIGILAAVGVVAYNGYTSSAKKAVSKSNHRAVVKYIKSEIAKCEFQEKIFNNWNCNNLSVGDNADRVARAAAQALNNFANNAYDQSSSAITLFHNNDVPGDIGIGKWAKDTLHIRTCFDSTCPAQTKANAPEIIQDTIYVE
jgi:type IV pilus assembly protein PilA